MIINLKQEEEKEEEKKNYKNLQGGRRLEFPLAPLFLSSILPFKSQCLKFMALYRG